MALISFVLGLLMTLAAGFGPPDRREVDGQRRLDFGRCWTARVCDGKPTKNVDISIWERIPAWSPRLLVVERRLSRAAVDLRPLILWTAFRTGKYRDGYREKLLGLVPRREGDATCVWIHAVSVGEVNLLATLLGESARPIPIGKFSSRPPAAPASSWLARNTPTSPCSTARSISVGRCERRCGASGRRCWCWRSSSSGRI